MNKITVIDLGNYNVKGIDTKGKQVTFKSNISRDYEKLTQMDLVTLT